MPTQELLLPAGVAKVPDGTAAAPALAFQADADVGLYRIGANVLGIATNGAEVARFDATNLVLVAALPVASGGTGITTAAQGALLHAVTANTWAALAVGAAGTVLVGGATVPSYSATPTVTSLTATTALNVQAATNQVVFDSDGAATGTLTWTPATTSKTITLPNLTGTAFLLDGGQTVTSGVWQGTAVGVAYGGTGLTTFTAAGALAYSTAATTLAALAAGTAEQVLTMNAGATAPAWSSAVPVVRKYTVTHTALQAAATVATIELFSAAAKVMLRKVVIKHSTAFSGGALSAYTVEVGITGNLNKYATAFDVFQAVAATTFQESQVSAGLEDFGSAVSIKITARSTSANTNASTAGSVDVWVETYVLP